MLTPYTKPFLDIPGQLALLKSRGLGVGEEAEAERLLKQYGYYRLSGYLFPLRDLVLSDDGGGKISYKVGQSFKAGTTLQQAIGLAEFDRKLRGLFLIASERIEIAMRVAVALLLGVRDPWSHRDPAQFHTTFTATPDPLTGMTTFDRWIARLDEHEGRSKEQFSKHFKDKYTGTLPLWISIEVWDFGMLSQLVGGMKVADQKAIATGFRIERAKLLSSWLRAINHVRNVSAHHSRLWNRSPADQAVPPKEGEFAQLDHLAADSFAHVRIYAVAAVMQYLLQQIEPAAAKEWAKALKDLFRTFPIVPGMDAKGSGFPEGWEGLDLWKSDDSLEPAVEDARRR